MTTTIAAALFNPAREAAGLPWATPHSLRHGLATLMVEEGYSPAKIAAHLGHADGGVLALRTYVHAEPLDSADFIDAALSASGYSGVRDFARNRWPLRGSLAETPGCALRPVGPARGLSPSAG